MEVEDRGRDTGATSGAEIDKAVEGGTSVSSTAPDGGPEGDSAGAVAPPSEGSPDGVISVEVDILNVVLEVFQRSIVVETVGQSDGIGDKNCGCGCDC